MKMVKSTNCETL